MHQQQTAFENMVGKEEVARNEEFLLFPQCFLLIQNIVSSFVIIYDIISLFAAELEEPKIGMWGKGLRLDHTELTDKFRMKHHFTRSYPFSVHFLFGGSAPFPAVSVLSGRKL